MHILDMSSNKSFISFAPVTLLDEIMQNLATIFSTKANTVPYMRDFGLPGDVIDEQMDKAKMILSIWFRNQVKEYEPRVNIKTIKWNETIDGELKPTISFDLK